MSIKKIFIVLFWKNHLLAKIGKNYVQTSKISPRLFWYLLHEIGSYFSNFNQINQYPRFFLNVLVSQSDLSSTKCNSQFVGKFWLFSVEFKTDRLVLLLWLWNMGLLSCNSKYNSLQNKMIISAWVNQVKPCPIVIIVTVCSLSWQPLTIILDGVYKLMKFLCLTV